MVRSRRHQSAEVPSYTVYGNAVDTWSGSKLRKMCNEALEVPTSAPDNAHIELVLICWSVEKYGDA